MRLYAKRLAHFDTLIGTHETPIPLESQSGSFFFTKNIARLTSNRMSRFVEVPFVLSNGNGQAGQSAQPVTLYLTITVSANPTSHPILPFNATDVSSMEHATGSTVAQEFIETTSFVVAATHESLSLPTDHVPVEISTPIPPVPDVQATMSPAENALRDADEATKAINLTSTWEGAVAGIKWVMDTVSPVAGVRRCAMYFYLMFDRADFRSQLNPYAQMAFGLVSAIPKVRYCRKGNS